MTTTLAQSAWMTIAEGATQGSSLERSKLRVCADQVGQSNQMSDNQSKCRHAHVTIQVRCAILFVVISSEEK